MAPGERDAGPLAMFYSGLPGVLWVCPMGEWPFLGIILLSKAYSDMATVASLIYL